MLFAVAVQGGDTPELLYASEKYNATWPAQAIEDLNSDGVRDFVVIDCSWTRDCNGIVTVSGKDGTNLNVFPPVFDNRFFSESFLGVISDQNGDGLEDIMVYDAHSPFGVEEGAEFEGSIYCISSVSGELLWNYEKDGYNLERHPINLIGMPDLDGDGRADFFATIRVHSRSEGWISVDLFSTGQNKVIATIIPPDGMEYDPPDNRMGIRLPDVTGDGIDDLGVPWTVERSQPGANEVEALSIYDSKTLELVHTFTSNRSEETAYYGQFMAATETDSGAKYLAVASPAELIDAETQLYGRIYLYDLNEMKLLRTLIYPENTRQVFYPYNGTGFLGDITDDGTPELGALNYVGDDDSEFIIYRNSTSDLYTRFVLGFPAPGSPEGIFPLPDISGDGIPDFALFSGDRMQGYAAFSLGVPPEEGDGWMAR